MKIDPQQWPAVSALFDEALDLPPDERPRWLDELPESLRVHRPTLESLLADHARVETQDFLETLPKADAMDDLVPDEDIPRVVGPYRLLRELGHGGMGSVWLAERSDGLLKRHVALKLPRLAWGGGLAERLARERDILASLAHPNIARLYDAGVDALGRPYLAMEFVDGQHVDAYCREHALPVNERLALLLQIASAVAHAHARLVVHRDLKPSNILVTRDAQVRLLDFGIAKLLEGDRTEETALTRVGGAALTLDYASPEQIRGEPLGTASDVYSLGVVAYELLTGTRPYRLKHGTTAELEQAIASIDAPLASQAAGDPVMRSRLRGDLDAILQQALRKDEAARYPGVEAFALDIEQHLRGLPVRAQADTWMYRARKFVRRHRLGVFAGLLVTLAIVAGAGGALWEAGQARAQAERAEQALQRQSAVRQLYVEAMAVVANQDASSLAVPGAVLKILRDKLRELGPQYKDRPQELLGMLNAVAVQLNFAGDFEGALDVGRDYLALLKSTHADLTGIVEAHMTVARNLIHLGRVEEGEAVLREAVAWYPRQADAAAQHSRAEAVPDLAWALIRQGKRGEAETILTAAQANAERYFPDDRYHFAILQMLGRLHLGYDDEAALRFARRARAGYAGYAQTESSELADTLEQLGAALLANGLAAEAETALREAEHRSQALYGSADRSTITDLGRLASAVARQGRHAEARDMLGERAAQLQRADTPDARDALTTVRGRQLENALLQGDMTAAAAFADVSFAPALERQAVRDADVFIGGEARWLSWSGRAAEAAQRLAAAEEKLKPAVRQGPAGFRLELARVEALYAAGRDKDAATATTALVRAMREAQATATWSFRCAVEWAALAAARAGEGRSGLRGLAEIDALRDPPPPPSTVERAESWLRRAQIDQTLGRNSEAGAELGQAMSLLHGQDAQSPRLAEGRRLAALLAPSS